MDKTISSMQNIINALKQMRLAISKDEFSMYDSINTVLGMNNIEYSREVQLGKGARIDYMVYGIGIEVKRGKPNKKVLYRQLQKYMNSNDIDGIILIVERNVDIPEQINSKPCFTFSLNKQWGIAI